MKCALKVDKDYPFLIIGYDKTLYLTDGSNNQSNQLQTKHTVSLSNTSITSLSSVMTDSFILCASYQGDVIILNAPTRDQ